MPDKPAFIPGFATRALAVQAGRRFFRSAAGIPAKEGRDFHVVPNPRSRWRFEEGAALPDPAPEETRL